MATAQRIKGQEVSILWVRDNELENTLTDISNFNIEDEYETKSVGYLGEKTNRKDYIFNGTKFDMELNLHTQDYYAFKQAIRDKAQRITPDVQFNITVTLQFPNGDAPEVQLNDVSFGANPMTISSRGDYVKVKLQGECSGSDDIES